MQIHAVLDPSGGIISITLYARFVGDPDDDADKALIAAFGDPEVDIGGSFTSGSPALSFRFPATEMKVGVTTELLLHTARFMLALPSATSPNLPAPVQGSLDCITNAPNLAAQIWFSTVVSRISQIMTALRLEVAPDPADFPDTTV